MEKELVLQSLKGILNIKEAPCGTRLQLLFDDINDPVITERFNLSGLCKKAINNNLSESDKSMYIHILDIVLAGYRDLSRDDVFPEGLLRSTEAMLYLYVFDSNITDQKRLEKYVAPLGLLLAKDKYQWLKKMHPKKATEEINWLIKHALVNLGFCKKESLSPAYVSFDDINVGELDRIDMIFALEKNLGLGEDSILCTLEFEDSLSNSAEKIYNNLFC